MEFEDFFHGFSLNAVDAKGRVSLPADFRRVVERRVRPDRAPGDIPAQDRQVLVGEHEELGCLVGYDTKFSRYLSDGLDRRVAALGDDVDLLRANDRVSLDAFGSVMACSYDEPGRMVLPITRKLVGITTQAFFIGANRSFQIWSPEAFLASDVEAPRAKRVLTLLLEEKAGKE